MPCNYSEYPENWKEIRERILIRANHKCEKCGLANHSTISNATRLNPLFSEWERYNNLLRNDYSPSQARKIMGFTIIVLTIAHLDNDHINPNVKDDRLQALCQACHLKLDINHHVENRKYGRKHRENNYKINFDL